MVLMPLRRMTGTGAPNTAHNLPQSTRMDIDNLNSIATSTPKNLLNYFLVGRKLIIWQNAMMSESLGLNESNECDRSGQRMLWLYAALSLFLYPGYLLTGRR